MQLDKGRGQVTMHMLRTIFASLALLVLASVGANAQSTPVKFLSVSGTNSTIVTPAKRMLLNGGIISNTTATIEYLKFYNTAVAPTCGTSVPVWTIMLPANLDTPLPALGLAFGSGLGFCITAAFADNDTSPAAAGIIVNLGVSSSPH